MNAISNVDINGTITVNGNKLNFPSTLDQYKIGELINMVLVLLPVPYNILVKVIIHL